MSKKDGVAPKLKLIKGGLYKVGVVRSLTAMTQTMDLQSPSDPEVNFKIKKATNREDVERKNFSSKIRFISNQEDGENVITERDFPTGDLEIETIKLCLVDWNLEFAEGKKLPITINNIKDYLTPEERQFLYDSIIEFNPLWSGRRDTKN